MSGSKVAEFRRRMARLSVRRVLVYATAPDSALMGYFDVERTDTACPQVLWKSFRSNAGITESGFFRYFHGIDEGHALVASRSVAFPCPFPISILGDGWVPPQGFRYVDAAAWFRLRAAVEAADSPNQAA